MYEYILRTGKRTVSLKTHMSSVTLRRPPRPALLDLPQALDKPFGSQPLEEAARGARRPVVVLPDATRGWQHISRVACEAALRIRRGTSAPITFVIGVGSHPPATNDEMRELVGDGASENDRVVSHNPDAGLVDMGVCTSLGTPVILQQDVATADFVVMTGGIAYHDLAGFSGGRKAIMPGVTAGNSIRKNHANALANPIHPGIGGGKLEGNPLHEDMMEFFGIYSRGKRAFLINTIPDDTGRPAAYVAGCPHAAWQKGIEIAKSLQTLYVDKPADVVVVSCGGAPFDMDLYQATKSLSAVADALAWDGAVILVAELPDGDGTEAFSENMIRSLEDSEAGFAEVHRHFTIPGFIAAKYALEYKHMRCAVVTPNMGIHFPGLITPDINEAYAKLIQGREPQSLLIVEAGNAVHLCRTPELQS